MLFESLDLFLQEDMGSSDDTKKVSFSDDIRKKMEERERKILKILS